VGPAAAHHLSCQPLALDFIWFRFRKNNLVQVQNELAHFDHPFPDSLSKTKTFPDFSGKKTKQNCKAHQSIMSISLPLFFIWFRFRTSSSFR
jgi:hypothetical protein